jgi:hypothetical protein
MARQPKPTLPSLAEAVLGRHLKAFLDWVDLTLGNKPDKRLDVFTISRSEYTLTLFDVGRYLRFTEACTLTVPPDGSVPVANGSSSRGAFTAGDVVHLRATDGQLTIAEGSGVTVTPPTDANLVTRGDVGSVMLVYLGDNEFDAMGDLEVP